MPTKQKQPGVKQAALIGAGATLGVIGAGVMGQTLIRGLLSSGLIGRDRLWAGEKNAATCETASLALEIPVEGAFQGRVPGADLILICVKPADAQQVMETLRGAGLRKETLLISILAGVGTARLEALLGTDNPVVRAMPNTPAIVSQGMTAICAGSRATAAHLETARRIFEAVGQCLAARMVQVTGRHPAALRDDVTTPAGCTIGGILMLEDGKIRSVLARAVEEATKIAAHLGAGPGKAE